MREPSAHTAPLPALGEVVVVEGAGASTALVEAAGRAADAGLEVLSARAVERKRSVAFGVAQQLLGPALARLDPRERAEVLSGAARLAAPVLEGAPSSGGQLSVIHGLYWLVSNLADRAPLALLVEDAQWADEPSLRLFEYLAQRIDEMPVALVVARRS